MLNNPCSLQVAFMGPLANNDSTLWISHPFAPDMRYCPVPILPLLNLMTHCYNSHLASSVSSLPTSYQPGKSPVLAESNFPPPPSLHPSSWSGWIKTWGIYHHKPSGWPFSWPLITHCQGDYFTSPFSSLHTLPPLHFQLITNPPLRHWTHPLSLLKDILSAKIHLPHHHLTSAGNHTHYQTCYTSYLKNK